eukprot:scaffold157943_cov28-Tisochrysis_lutea.AAC.5
MVIRWPASGELASVASEREVRLQRSQWPDANYSTGTGRGKCRGETSVLELGRRCSGSSFIQHLRPHESEAANCQQPRVFPHSQEKSRLACSFTALASGSGRSLILIILPELLC